MLDKIVAKQRLVLPEVMQARPLSSFESKIAVKDFALSKSIAAREWSLIAECKLSSPVKGSLCADKTVPELAAIYEANGAAALSVHTNEHFSGKLEDLSLVKKITNLPVLRKEFIIHPYQVYETAYAGADALLLIARILSDKELRELRDEAKSLGLDCLVEAHDKEDIEKALSADCQLLGINNRDLKSFTTNVEHTLQLIPFCEGRTVISESGFKSQKEALAVKAAGAKGVLMGEGLVKAEGIGKKTREMALLEDE